VIEVRILDVIPRGCSNPAFQGRAFGSNAAAWWGFHYNDLLTEPKPREVITIYEIDAAGDRNWARAVYNYRWVPQTEHSDEARPLRGRHYATAGAQVFYCPPISKRQTCPTRCLKDRRSDTL
jgi:hypothetical protein